MVEEKKSQKRRERSWVGGSNHQCVDEEIRYTRVLATSANQSLPPSKGRSSIYLANIEAAVNDRGDGTNFRAQLLLHAAKSMAVLVRDKVDRQSQVAETARTSNAMQVGLAVLWEIKVDDDID